MVKTAVALQPSLNPVAMAGVLKKLDHTNPLATQVGKGCIVASSEFYLSDGALHFSATATSDCTVLRLAYRDIRDLETKSPRAAMGLYKLIGYFLSRKNSQSKRQIQQLTDLYS